MPDPRERKIRAAAYSAFAALDAKGVRWRGGEFNAILTSYIMRSLRDPLRREHVEALVEAEREIFANWADWLAAQMPLD